MVQRVWAATSYAATAKQLLHLYKFEHVQAAFGTIAEAMDEALPLLPPEIVVVPLPTATSRVRQRGYDHARLLARTIAAKRQLLYLPILHRLTQTRQVGATRQQRLGQLQGAFWVSRTKLLGGHSVLLIDDVATTGASLTHAAQSLMQAGAQTVEALVFAQRQ
ncbi:MAG TPA: phosphoribosyltransferase family protein [Patescibacteria group bacterium]|nr:phosphoribosyltransferase family protein [Patescibacteria group bacterium]